MTRDDKIALALLLAKGYLTPTSDGMVRRLIRRELITVKREGSRIAFGSGRNRNAYQLTSKGSRIATAAVLDGVLSDYKRRYGSQANPKQPNRSSYDSYGYLKDDGGHYIGSQLHRHRS